MKASKVYWWMIGGGCALVPLIVLTILCIVRHLNSTDSNGSWLGVGTLVLIAIFLIFLGIMALIAWVSIRNVLNRKVKAKAKAEAATTGKVTTPAPPKKSKFWYGVKAVLAWTVVVLVVFAVCRVLQHIAIGTPFNAPFWVSAPKPPELNCANWVELDAHHAEDHRQDSMDKPVYVNPGTSPSPDQKMCWSTWVTLPPYASWDVKFNDPTAAKDGCIAWLEYEGIDRIYGPFQGTQTIGFSRMPARFRIATNCKIVSYET